MLQCQFFLQSSKVNSTNTSFMINSLPFCATDMLTGTPDHFILLRTCMAWGNNYIELHNKVVVVVVRMIASGKMKQRSWNFSASALVICIIIP